jgi:uncharacterized protein
MTRLSLGTTLLMMAAMMFSACNIQNRLLYFPDSSVPSEEALRLGRIAYWPRPGTEYRGFAGTNVPVRHNGTIVVFHGNAGTAADRTYYVEALAPLGYRIVLAEYPAYGGRTGKLGETAFVRDGRETVRLAFEQFGGPLFLLGESLGAGVAAAVARDCPVKLHGILLMTPWDTLTAIAQATFPYLPVRLLLTDSYDSIGNLRSFDGRIAVVGAERDDIIPIRHANALYESLPGPAKRMWTVHGAGHNNWPAVVGPQWWKEVMEFAGSAERS